MTLESIKSYYEDHEKGILETSGAVLLLGIAYGAARMRWNAAGKAMEEAEAARILAAEGKTADRFLPELNLGREGASPIHSADLEFFGAFRHSEPTGVHSIPDAELRRAFPGADIEPRPFDRQIPAHERVLAFDQDFRDRHSNLQVTYDRETARDLARDPERIISSPGWAPPERPAVRWEYNATNTFYFGYGDYAGAPDEPVSVAHGPGHWSNLVWRTNGSQGRQLRMVTQFEKGVQKASITADNPRATLWNVKVGQEQPYLWHGSLRCEPGSFDWEPFVSDEEPTSKRYRPPERRPWPTGLLRLPGDPVIASES